MKEKIIGLFAIIIFFIACSKDKFQTKPTLKLKSISSKTIPPNGSMRIDLEYTDKQGDISEDSLTFIKIRNNQIVKPTLRDTIMLILAKFPSKDKGVIELNLNSTYLQSAEDPSGPGNTNYSDSLTMKFVLHDNASNKSDTLVIKDIVIER